MNESQRVKRKIRKQVYFNYVLWKENDVTTEWEWVRNHTIRLRGTKSVLKDTYRVCAWLDAFDAIFRWFRSNAWNSSFRSLFAFFHALLDVNLSLSNISVSLLHCIYLSHFELKCEWASVWTTGSFILLRKQCSFNVSSPFHIQFVCFATITFDILLMMLFLP